MVTHGVSSGRGQDWPSASSAGAVKERKKSQALRWGVSGLALAAPSSSHRLTARLLAAKCSKLSNPGVLLQLGTRGIAWEEVVQCKAIRVLQSGKVNGVAASL